MNPDERKWLLTYTERARTLKETPREDAVSMRRLFNNFSNPKNYSHFGRNIMKFINLSNEMRKKNFIDLLKEIYPENDLRYTNITRYGEVPREELVLIFMNGSERQTNINHLKPSELGDRSKTFLYEQYELLNNLNGNLDGINIGTFYFSNAIIIVRTSNQKLMSKLLQCYLSIDKISNTSGGKTKRKKDVKKSKKFKNKR